MDRRTIAAEDARFVINPPDTYARFRSASGRRGGQVRHARTGRKASVIDRQFALLLCAKRSSASSRCASFKPDSRLAFAIGRDIVDLERAPPFGYATDIAVPSGTPRHAT
jgi:hypothetical protein